MSRFCFIRANETKYGRMYAMGDIDTIRETVQRLPLVAGNGSDWASGTAGYGAAAKQE